MNHTRKSYNQTLRTVIYSLIGSSLLLTSFPGWTQQENLTEREVKDLLYLLEEEKMARDVYTSFNEAYGMQVFEHIAQSEQRHMDKVRSLIESYNINYVLSDAAGVFQNEAIQNLYDSLVAKGKLSAREALQVGRLIEETNITDLGNAIVQTKHPELILGYTRLMEASGRHKAAFTRHLENSPAVPGQCDHPRRKGQKARCTEASND